MPGERLISFESVSFSAIETGRHFHVNGITVNNTIQTVESAAPGGAFRIEDVCPLIDGGARYPIEWGGVRLRIDPARDSALFFRCLARGTA